MAILALNMKPDRYNYPIINQRYSFEAGMQTPLFRRLFFTAALCALTPPLAAAQTGAGPELLFEQTSQWQLPYAPADIVQSVDGARIFVLTDNNRILIYEPNGQLKGSVEVAPGVTAIESDARGENLLLIDAQNKTLSSFSIDFVAEIDITGSPFKGNPDAPVTIAVFSDFE
jgi:hypothetical protein